MIAEGSLNHHCWYKIQSISVSKTSVICSSKLIILHEIDLDHVPVGAATVGIAGDQGADMGPPGLELAGCGLLPPLEVAEVARDGAD